MSEPIEAIEAALRGAGLTDKPGEFDSDIHSWRCEHPDVYGACDCFQELVRDLAEVEVRKSAVEGNPVVEPGVTKEIAFVRGAVWGAAQGAAPVLPSSGVDEDACWHVENCRCRREGEQ